ncbi:unnamed protein product [Paramecium pentaurelia]|uniref:Uncharacterized protein n=1 Tax=Paramecium pentaurelia TaxID=43138 RepID=A0A8S1T4I2_9CILI|nr:unnamed protein product [Paramecium pentaurelia]
MVMENRHFWFCLKSLVIQLQRFPNWIFFQSNIFEKKSLKQDYNWKISNIQENSISYKINKLTYSNNQVKADKQQIVAMEFQNQFRC